MACHFELLILRAMSRYHGFFYGFPRFRFDYVVKLQAIQGRLTGYGESYSPLRNIVPAWVRLTSI